jgi:CRISPR-associated protein Cst2
MIYELGIFGRLVIEAHSLNNEGTTGNVTEPRTVILSDGTKTDGISGEMLKHMHVEALWQLSKVADIHLCDPCKILSPMKADGNPDVTGKKSVVEAMSEALKCLICDVHGFLVQRPTLSRKSTVEFGWALALPQRFHRDIHVHTRVAAGEKERGKEVPEQMIYNRPTRSGTYAFVTVFQPWRIGLNEVNYGYEIEEITRMKRYMLAIDAYKSMMTRLEGAMTTTRLPHFGTCEGVVVTSVDGRPVPVISPLVDGYISQVTTIAGANNVRRFDSLPSLLEILEEQKALSPAVLGVKPQ